VRLGKVDAEVHEHSFDRLLRSLSGVEAHGPFDANVRIEHKFGDGQIVCGLVEPDVSRCR
jgi:hypothetical protein